MRKITVLLALVGLCFSFGCKKSDNNGTSGCTLSTASLAGAYVRTAYTVQASSSSAIVNQFALETACAKDDILTLKTDGTYTWTDGPLVCGTRPNGTWSLPGGNGINVDRNYGIITQFDCSSWTLSTPAGVFPIEITTFKRQ